MAKILFWNCFCKPIDSQIAAVCRDHDIDIGILAEAKEINQATLLPLLNQGTSSTYTFPVQYSERIKIFSRFPSDGFQPISDAGPLSAYEVTPPLGLKFLLVGVHLRSKSAAKEVDQILECVRVAEFLDECENSVGHQRTIVIGDFNMNPFEAGMVAADGLHAVMDRKIALKQSRVVGGRARSFFYNPMWSRMGDSSVGPAGTYHYSDSQNVVYFWNTFDQVLVRPCLIPYVPENGVSVLTEVCDYKFLNRNGKPDQNHSDHLPIIATVEIEKYYA